MEDFNEVILPSSDSNTGSHSDFEWPTDAISINASVTTYRHANGRQYDAAGKYWAPNDDRQNENLDINNHLFSLMQQDKLFLAPLEREKIKNVLDVGTGTGIWAIDFADEFPDARVIGTDISAIQPTSVPPNLFWIIDDCETSDWNYDYDNDKRICFDYIHIRTLFGSIRDWPTLYEKAYRNLEPGGWFEHFEVSPQVRSDDNTVKPDSPLAQYSNVFRDASLAKGTPFMLGETMKEDIEAAGFQQVQEYTIKAPLGRWPADPRLKEIGAWCEFSFNTGLEGWAMQVLTEYLKWNANEVQVFLAQVREDAKNRRIHSYYNITVVVGQKPYDAPKAAVASATSGNTSNLSADAMKHRLEGRVAPAGA